MASLRASGNTILANDLLVHPTGNSVKANPWDGIQYATSPDGQRGVLSHTLPSAMFILIPVFVTSNKVTVDAINHLLESSWTARIKAQPIPPEAFDDPSAYRGFIPRFVLPPLRDPYPVIGPTDWPVSAKDTELPFLGQSLADVLASWLGTDEATSKDGVAPFRPSNKVADRLRRWSPNSFLVLDEHTMAKGSEPTALLVFLSYDSEDETKVETVRCEFPVALRFSLILLGGDEPIMRYVKEKIVSDDGILRYGVYDDWFKRDGPADKDVADGRFPDVTLGLDGEYRSSRLEPTQKA